MKNFPAKKILKKIATCFKSAGFDCYAVGGCVRDWLDGKSDIKDIDVEVFGPTYEQMVTILSEFGEVNQVGKSFLVAKLRIDSIDFDFSIPRQETKTGDGHTGFEVIALDKPTVRHAAMRRDFTINAIYRHCLDGTICDPFGGQYDLKMRILRPVSPLFVEDPLRVLRGFQFIARFGLTMDIIFIKYAVHLQYEIDTISVERVWGEWEKWMVKGYCLGDALHCLSVLGKWLPSQLDSLNTDFSNTLFNTLNLVRLYAYSEWERKVLTLATLRRYILQTNRESGTREWMATDFFKAIGCPITLDLAACALTDVYFVMEDVSEGKVRRLLNQLAENGLSLKLLEALIRMHEPIPAWFKNIQRIAVQLHTEPDGKTKPLINGFHLMETFGYQQGKELGGALKELYERQLDGHFDTVEDGLALVKK